ncbi:ankyrin repeat domain-containing protein, chloroplastic isoform X2 [Telopea speciosissima]|uniref:ankyrin repeat domain-containing protein, chloroplastic isoform X2 n=1 Tax=Telopea speciosissima TaxID=54955 RepID=UPI001CC7BAFD|nr:ankyrin repeat domain-containing protein, chloroplastic isoform X2 [Telopea speciosissima]
MQPFTLHKSQIPQIFSLIPNSPFHLSVPTQLSTGSGSLTFSRNISSLSFSISASLSSFSHSSQQETNQVEDDELVIGDCVVFEEGVFEDPYLQDNFHGNKPNKKKSKPVVEENLVPDNWKELQAEINLTKKEKRKIAQELEYGRRVEKKKPVVDFRDTVKFLTYRSAKLAQLKPVVLDNPTYPLKEEEVVDEDKNVSEVGSSSSGRVPSRNPRKAVYGGTLEDISDFFNSPKYQPGEDSGKKSEGRKLFTKEEKVLLNKRIPNLADATCGKWLPLHTLTASGEFYLVDSLLKHNVDINAADKDGLTALHRAIICKKQAIMNYLLRENANPFVRDKEGATLMHYAVQTASSHAIKILLLYNVDINLPDDNGWTPLHLAVQTRRTDTVRLLLIKGANKTLKNRDCLAPLELCLYSGKDTRTYELIKLLKQLPKSQ